MYDGFGSQSAAHNFHLSFQRFDIRIDKMPGACGCVKIAVETPRPAERDVDVNT
jgi:hypothetical protein